MQRYLSLPAVVLTTMLPILALAGCQGGDVESGEADPTQEAALPPGVDPALALSSDPVDQMNLLLAQSVRLVPGEPLEVRFQFRRLGGDSIRIDYEQHVIGEPWPPAPAWAVASLDDLRPEIVIERGVELQCDEENCVEYRAPMDSVELSRLPVGEEGDWFRELLADLASGTTDVQAAGGEEAINRRLESTARHYSETVRAWYHVAFRGDWMDLRIRQQTEGFPVNTLPSVVRIHLPGLEPRSDGVLTCETDSCLLDVQETPFRVVLNAPEEAARFVELFNELKAEG